MKISSLLHGFNIDWEEKKRAVQRKTAGDAYKKHANYTDASKKQVVRVLENLLSGKTEKDLREADVAVQEGFLQTSIATKGRLEVNEVMQQAQVQQTDNAYEKDKAISFAERDLAYDSPERFPNDVKRNSQKQIIFGKEVEDLLFQRTYNKAVEKYTSHIAMVKAGYIPFVAPVFSQSA